MLVEAAKQCCKWHNCLPTMIVPGALPDISAKRHMCGLAEEGIFMVCCADCPYINKKMVQNGLSFAKEIAEQQ